MMGKPENVAYDLERLCRMVFRCTERLDRMDHEIRELRTRIKTLEAFEVSFEAKERHREWGD